MTGSSSDTVTALEVRIIKQIEFYFSDVNLWGNKFLKEKIQEDDGWVTIDTMLNFKRLRMITHKAQIICEALKKSSSGLLEVSEQGDKIRRSPSKPLPVDIKKTITEIIDRTIYAKPFPLDVKLDDLQEFFEAYGQLDEVIMRKHCEKKTFKGSVFVTFANKDDAVKFVSEEETKFKEQALEFKCFKTNYYKQKAAREKTKGKKDTERKPHMECEDSGKEEDTEADLEERVNQKRTKNAVLHLKGLNSQTGLVQVKAFFSNVLQSDVAWVDFDKGATEGYIILRKPDSAGSTLEKAKTAKNGKIVIRDLGIKVRVVEGDEELQYWKRLFQDIADKKKSEGKGRRKVRRNHRGGRSKRNRQKDREGSQGERKQNQKEDSYGGSSDGEEQDTEEPPVNFIKLEKVTTRPQGKRKQNKMDDSSDGEEKDTKEPPAKIIKSEMIITKPQGKRKQNRKNASSDGEEQDTEETPAKVIRSEMFIKFNEVTKLHDASSDKQEQDREEPPATSQGD